MSRLRDAAINDSSQHLTTNFDSSLQALVQHLQTLHEVLQDT